MMSKSTRPTIVLLLAAVAGLPGCLGGSMASAGYADPPASDAIKVDNRMTQVELDQFCIGFGERYVTVIGNGCNHVERATKDPGIRARAHSFKLQTASSVYDIATGTNPFAKLMDFILLAELQDLVWNREGQAAKSFGEAAAAPLTKALQQGREDAWGLAARILKPEQRSVLETMIAEWRQAHPDAEAIAFVRFDDFAEYRGKTVLDGVPLGAGLLAPVSEATRQLAETRLLAERSMYLAKRMPLLLRWHAEAFMNSVLSREEFADWKALADRVATLAESLPSRIADERVVVLKSAQDRVNHRGDVVRASAIFIAGLMACLIVLIFALALVYRRMAPRAPRPATPA